VSKDNSEHRLKECPVFYSFCSYEKTLNIEAFSIEHGQEGSGEPDFICRTISGDRLLFELCELATPEIKKQDKSGQQQPESCVTEKEAAQFRRVFPATKFTLDRLREDGKDDVAAVVRWLLRQEPDYVLPARASGSTIPYWLILGPKRRRGAIHVEPGAAGCTDLFKVYNCTSFGSAVEERIRDKVKKSKRTPYRLGGSIVRPQLVLYYALEDPFLPDHKWENTPDGSALRRLWEPHFTDIWVFKECPPKVLSHYHEGEASSGEREPQG
jgi:hypothetical protein